jgi:hypothetical protein
VLVDPDVAHLVEQVPAGHLVDEHGAHVDPTIPGVAKVSAASGPVRVESDLDGRSIQPRTLETRHRPPGEFLLGRVVRDHHNAGPDLHSGGSYSEGPSPRERQQSEDRHSETTDRAHGRTVEPGT